MQTLYVRDSKQLTKTTHVLLYLLAAQSAFGDTLGRKSLSSAAAPEVARYFREKKLDRTLRRLHNQGWIKTEYKEARKIFRLTNKGEIEALIAAVHMHPKPVIWDGSWRLIMFDIPEQARSIRAQLRHSLRDLGFLCLQASIYVSPHPISPEALALLKKSGLLRYIRIARANFEDDTDLRKLFRVRT